MPIDGTWYNELGSQMVVSSDGQSLSGQYSTAVGSAEGWYPLTGSLDSSPSNYSQAAAFTVAWVNAQSGSSQSATGWVGQYQFNGDVEQIVTTWLLVSETPAGYDWASTGVGQDVFTRNPPTPEQVAARLRRGGAVPPGSSQTSGLMPGGRPPPRRTQDEDRG